MKRTEVGAPSPSGLQPVQVSEYVWEIPRCGGMRVPGRVYASSALM
jgi:hypothetical protein